MRVGIADQSVVCEPVEQALDCPGAEAESPHEVGTGCQARGALGFVIEFTRISHRLTEIFLMTPLDSNGGGARPVKAVKSEEATAEIPFLTRTHYAGYRIEKK